MSFSFASVILSYFLIAGGTWGAGLLAARFGISSEYLAYLILGAGGFLGGMVAARASRGSTILEPAIGGGLLLVSLIAVGIIASGGSASMLFVPSSMKAIAMTAGASAVGGIAGAFVAEKLFGHVEAGAGGWLLYTALAGFGVGVVGTMLGTAIGSGSSGAMFGMLVVCSLLLGLAAGASATKRILGVSFLGTAIGLFGFFFLAVYLFTSLFGSTNSERGGETGLAAIPSEVYAGLATVAAGAGIVALIGAAIGWTTWGKSSSAK
ncbi:hypothetical protein BH11MYX3_BH11MYX3_29880 [soil metagenome]